MMNILYKNTKSDILDVDIPSRTVKARIVNFDNVDSDGDIIKQDAVKKSVAERGPKGSNEIFHLLQHDRTLPLGKPKSIDVTSEGMDFITAITPTTYGLDTLKLYADGVYNNHSIGFQIISSHEEIVNEEKINVITELKAWEGSTVTWGANSETPFIGFKSKSFDERNDMIVERLKKLNKAVKDGRYSDETFVLLSQEIESLIEMQKSLTENSRSKDTGNKEKDFVEIFRNNLNFI